MNEVVRPRPERTPRKFVIDVVQVLVLCTVVGLALWLMMGHSPRHNLIYSWSIGLSIYIIGYGLSYIRGEQQKSAGVFIVAIPIGGVIGVVLGSYLLGLYPSTLVSEHPRTLVTSSVAALLFGSVISYYFYARHRIAEGDKQVQAEAARQAQNEQRLAETELKLLQAQIEPHFLFNTLSNVRALIDTEPDKAKAMLESLTVFLRGSLNRTRDFTCTLGHELHLVESYLAIHAIRMGERLRYRIDAENGVHDIEVPPLLVQPIVENAVRHGLEPGIAGGDITITARTQDDTLLIEVADTGQGFNATETSGMGVGLHNTRERLRNLYGTAGQLELIENAPHGIRARLHLPLRSQVS